MMAHTSAQPSTLAPPSAGSPPAFPTGGGDVPLVPSSGTGQHQLAISNGVLLAAVIFLFMVVVFVFLLYIYAKRYLGANPQLAPGSPSSGSRFIFVAASPLPQRGLPAAVLRSLPITVYDTAAKEGDAEALECAVCLSEVAGGEKVRALSKCGHGFHVECIDMWFHSHDTCPLCRAPVAAAGLDALPREDPAADSFPVFPTNVLFWGNQDDVANSDLSAVPPPAQTAGAVASSSSSSPAAARGRKENLVIDIPTRAVGPLRMTSPLPASRMPGFSGEEMRSPVSARLRSPVSARLRSLRRLLSRGKQAVVGTSSYSPRAAAGDIEQGLPSADPAARPPPPPKTPKTPPSGN